VTSFRDDPDVTMQAPVGGIVMKQQGLRVAGAVLTTAVAGVVLAGCSQAPTAAPAATPTPVAKATGDPGTNVANVTDAEPGRKAVDCSVVRDWNTAPDDGGLTLSPAPLTQVRVGRHTCYDRVVFDVAGRDPVGFIARYVPVVRADGSGESVPVAGTGALEMVVRAPFIGTDDPQAWQDMPRVGDELVPTTQLSGWTALRSVTFAGSFEGQSTIAIGVHDKRSFRVWTSGTGDQQRVILDIAH
jgi:hypothetical protein